jgi:hypothetical protein
MMTRRGGESVRIDVAKPDRTSTDISRVFRAVHEAPVRRRARTVAPERASAGGIASAMSGLVPEVEGALREMASAIERGGAILFSGAGFSAGALDVARRRLPDAEEMRIELWQMLFGDEEPDDSSLQDLYDIALERVPEQLGDYVAHRLRIGDAPLPPHYATWFSAPWRRIYTLNVDDLETAVQRQFSLPRRLVCASRTEPASRAPLGSDELEIVHLNGLAADGARALTFSTFQYAARLCGRDPDYERLAGDMTTAPFVFAGTTLDEIVLWQHFESQHQRAGDEGRPPSWLIAPSLSRARQLLLADIGVRWMPTTIEAVAAYLPCWRAQTLRAEQLDER